MHLQTEYLITVFNLFFIHRICATLDALKTLGYDWKHVLERIFDTESKKDALYFKYQYYCTRYGLISRMVENN